MARKIIFLLLFKLSINMIVFPFKTTYVNKNGDINKDSKEYNSTHFGRDNFDMPLYTQIKLGNPSQPLKVILSSEICGSFKIGQSTKCIYSDEYLSYYNRNLSNDFNYTSQFDGTDPEFNNKKGGQTAVDTIYAYSDIKLENETQFKGIGFYLGTDTDEKLCGTIGFEKDDLLCYKIINITSYLKVKKYIDNYKFIIKYNSTEEGSYIIGGELKDIIKDYDENKTFSRKVNVKGGLRDWEINISSIKEENSNESLENEIKGSFHNDLSLILGSKAYRDYLINNTFKEYFQKEICSLNVFDKDPSYSLYYKYQIIECDKEKFGINDIKKFPKLIFYTREYGSLNEFSFDYNDLFTETKYKYFYNVIFDYFGIETWKFGKIFLRKYPINFDYNSQTIEVYDYHYKNEEKQGNNGKKNKDKKALYIIIITILVIITGVLGYFLGKYINKIRKKRANELSDDDYDYLPEAIRETKK